MQGRVQADATPQGRAGTREPRVGPFSNPDQGGEENRPAAADRFHLELISNRVARRLFGPRCTPEAAY